MNWKDLIVGVLFLTAWIWIIPLLLLISTLISCGSPDMPKSCEVMCKENLPEAQRFNVRRVCRCNFDGEKI